MKRSRLALGLCILLGIIAALGISGCGKKSVEPISKQGYALDTLCNITIYDKSSEAVLQKCYDRLQEVESKMSVDLPASEVSKINQMAGVKPVKVSEDTFHVISSGKSFSLLTGGKFDITVGPLVKLWGINTPHARVPAPAEIKAVLPLINYKNIVLNAEKQTIMLARKGMRLDLGGIAKGFAGDQVKNVLLSNGVKHGIIDLGGNILAVGSKTDGSAWRIGVQDPSSTRGEYLGIVRVRDKAVVTSGIYERYFMKNGKRYHHIMDTKTGYPVDNELASVSIVTDVSMNADALAKAFCFGVQKGLKFIEAQKNVEAIFVTRDKKVYITPGLKKSFEVTNDEYRLMN